MGVNELQAGSAASPIDDISREFEKLRFAAGMLGLPNPNSINWTLIVLSTTDSAATQKRMNRLIKDCRQGDEERFGPATTETIDVIETFCSMHLGVNLRKAFLNGLVDTDDDSEKHYYRVDTQCTSSANSLENQEFQSIAWELFHFLNFLKSKFIQPLMNNNCLKI